MRDAIVTAPGADRQPPPPNPRVVDAFEDDTIRLLAKAVHVARTLLDLSAEPPVIFEALSVDQQRALEGEAVEIIRAGNPIARRVAIHRAAQEIGVSPERFAEGLIAYGSHLQGI